MITFLRKHVFHNLLLKVFSLLVAVLMWMAVARDPIAEVAVTVPIEFQHVPENLEISSERIPEVQIRVRGPGHMVRSLAQSEVHAVLNLSDAHPGEHTYDLAGPQIRVPREVEVVQVVPTQLHLTFDRRATKEVPVKPRVIGLYAAGPRTDITVEPASALLIGPEKRVQSIESAYTDAVDAAGVVGKASFSGIHVYVTDPLVRVARPQAVSVTVSQEPAAATQRPAGSSHH
ncbi:MAG: YbbR-like domain-containing protein [Terriglobales bacterium]